MIKLILKSEIVSGVQLNNTATGNKQLDKFAFMVVSSLSSQPAALYECFICGFHNVVLGIYFFSGCCKFIEFDVIAPRRERVIEKANMREVYEQRFLISAMACGILINELTSYKCGGFLYQKCYRVNASSTFK